VAIDDGTLSETERIAVIRGGAWMAAAAVIPGKRRGSVGAPRTFPDYLWPLLVDQLWVIGMGSSRKLMRELGRGGKWRVVRRKVHRYWTDLPEVPAKPPARQTFEYYRDRYLADSDETAEKSAEIHTAFAANQAGEAGNLVADGGGSFAHPARERTVYGDGKVLTPMFKAKTTADTSPNSRPRGLSANFAFGLRGVPESIDPAGGHRPARGADPGRGGSRRRRSRPSASPNRTSSARCTPSAWRTSARSDLPSPS